MGLSFTLVFRALITGRRYVVLLELKTNDVQEPLITIRNITANIEWNISHMNASYPVVDRLNRTVKNFNNEFHKLFLDMNEFLKYLVGRNLHRQRRGAINILGSIYNVLFGTATQEQIDRIHLRLQRTDNLN